VPRSAKWIAAAAVACVVAVALFVSFGRRSVPVVEPTRRELVQSLVVTGRVRAPSRIELGTLTAGNVAEVLVDEGDEVRTGQLLLRLDDAEEQAAVAQARAALAQAQAQQARLRSVQLPQADAALAQADAQLVQAERQWERYRKLHAQGAISDATLDDAEQRLEAARAQRRRAAVDKAGASSGGVEARVAEAAVANAQATLELAEARLARTRLLAPAGGTVLARDVEPGDAVQPGRVLLVLGARGRTEIVIEPDERNLALLAVGQPALVSADAFPQRTFPATVSRIAPSVDVQRGIVEVRLAVPDPPPFLRPDMTVSADVEVARKPDALVLPAEAVHDLGTDTPWALVVEDGRAVRRDLHLGIRGDRYVEVLEGVAAGTQVITDAAVRPGDRVRADGAAPERG